MQNIPDKPKRSRSLKRWFKSTSKRTFVVYPILVFLFELALHAGRIHFVGWNLLAGVPLLIWGFGQYRLSGQYRTRIGGGGPGIDVPPERMVDQGIYAYTRNPMYLGHLIFMLGLAITFWSWAALLLLGFHVFWFNQRVVEDEGRLIQIFGPPYADYQKRVKRWIPYVI